MQETIVAIIVVFAAWSVAKRYAPKALRQACRNWTTRMAKRLGWITLERRLVAKAQAEAACSDGCGSCKGCGPVGTTSEVRSTITPDELRRSLKP